MSAIEIKVPDIGDFKDIPVIEIFVKPGDTVKAEDSLVSLESDKATMDVPSPSAGTVKEIKVKVGDKVSEGVAILTLEEAEKNGATAASNTSEKRSTAAPSPTATPAQPTSPGSLSEVKVPDIGDFKDIPVIEIFVKPGDKLKAEDPLVSLESDKATMDVPSPSAGTVKEVKVKVGDKVSEGVTLLILEQATDTDQPATGAAQKKVETASTQSGERQRSSTAGQPDQAGQAGARPAPAPATLNAGLTEPSLPEQKPPADVSPAPVDEENFKKAHASPSIRAFARELGVDLTRVKGSGPKGRILQPDVQNFVKEMMSGRQAASGAPAVGGPALSLLPWPQVDFSKFGPVEAKPLSRIKKISGANLHRNWVLIPHVTNHDDADITELEAFRVQLNKENEKEKSGIKLTMLAFLIKACVAALQKFPEFNASLDGDNLILKHYYHVGFAADTPNGLMVPVVKNADQKGVLAIAKETADLAAKAREGKLAATDMQGGCFSISSLGGIGGTYFTPIINAPEVAILGVCRSATRPVWDGKQFAPRLMLPLSLSWDHRVIDGASAGRFNSYLASILADMRRVML